MSKYTKGHITYDGGRDYQDGQQDAAYGAVDDLYIRASEIHIERLDDTSYYVTISEPTGRTHRLEIVKRGRGINLEHQLTEEP